MSECRACGGEFVKARALQRVCSLECSVRDALRKRMVKERREARAALRSKESIQKKLKRAETAINLYVRLRDHDQGCISCNLPSTWGGQWHASHYRSVKAASQLRFNLWNIHKACVGCNKWKGGNIHDYTPNLIAKIGAKKVKWLNSNNQIVRYTPEYLERLRAVFAKKARCLKKRIESRNE